MVGTRRWAKKIFILRSVVAPCYCPSSSDVAPSWYQYSDIHCIIISQYPASIAFFHHSNLGCMHLNVDPSYDIFGFKCPSRLVQSIYHKTLCKLAFHPKTRALAHRGSLPASQKLSSIVINVRQLPSFLTARFRAGRWCINIGTLVRGLARVMLKIQYDIDTMNKSITKVLKRFANKGPPPQPGEALRLKSVVAQKRVQSTKSTKHARQGASAQFMSSKFSFCSACFTDFPRYMRRRVRMTACDEKHMNGVHDWKRYVTVRKVDQQQL